MKQQYFVKKTAALTLALGALVQPVLAVVRSDRNKRLDMKQTPAADSGITPDRRAACSRRVLLGMTAVLVPGVALAENVGDFISFTTSRPAVNAVGRAVAGSNPGGVGVDAFGDNVGLTASSPKVGVEARSRITGVVASGDQNGVAAVGVTGVGVSAISTQGTAIKAEGFARGMLLRSNASGSTGIDANGGILGVRAVARENNGIGLDAWGDTAIRAVSTSVGGPAIDASCTQTPGSFCSGVFAKGDEGVIARGKHIGVEARSELTTGVAGSSTNGVGGRFSGGKAALQIFPQTSAGKPTSGNHERGEMLMDSTGVLFVCTASGVPGTWKKVVLQ